MNKKSTILALAIFAMSLTSWGVIIPSSGSTSITTCANSITDPGGSSNYSNNVNGTLTINPGTAGSKIRLTFSTFATESQNDYLYVYDGVSTSATLLGRFSGTTTPGVIYASNSTGALTLRFTSDGSLTYQGFQASIACVESNPNAIDLTVPLVSISKSEIIPGSYNTVSYSITNTGTVSSGNFTTGIYLSTDTLPSTNDTFLSSRSFSSLASGNSYTNSNSFTISSSMTPGKYYLLVVADYSNLLIEKNETNNTFALPIIVAEPTYDFNFSSISSNSGSIISGQNFSVSATLSNYGNSTTPNFNLGFYLSQDSELSANDSLIHSTSRSGISANSATSVSQTLSVSKITNDGLYYIIIKADYLNTVSELNESNNTISIPFLMQKSDIDLTIEYEGSAISIASGSSLSLSYKIQNRGKTPATTSYVGYYLSQDSVFNLLEDSYITSEYLSTTIAGNSFIYETDVFSINSTIPSGKYFLFIVSDYTNTIEEINETNNHYRIPLTITPGGSDLVPINSSISPRFVVPGGQVSASTVISNQGTLTASSNYVGYYFSTDTILSADDTYLSSSSVSSISSSYSNSAYQTLTIPTTTVKGSAYILFKVDYLNIVSELNETNNIEYIPITITSISGTTYKLPVTGSTTISTCEATIYDDGGIDGNYSNSSQGTLIINPSEKGSHVKLEIQNIDLYNSSDYLRVYDGPSTSSPLLGTFYNSLNATTLYGNNSSGALTLYFYSSSSGNDYGFTLGASCVDKVAGPDLTVTQNTLVSNQVYAGSSLSSLITISNIGAQPISSTNNRLGYYLSSDSIFDINDQLILSYSLGSMVAGYSSSINRGVTLPITTIPGDYYLIMKADDQNVVFEDNETNNISSLPITVNAPTVDLYISSASLNKSIWLDSETNYLSGVVNNRGSSASEATSISVLLSSDQFEDASDSLLTTINVYSVNASYSRSFNLSDLQSINGIAPGLYYLILKVDHSNLIEEETENNNSYSIPFILQISDVDFKITNFEVTTPKPIVGAYTSLTYSINNLGKTNAPSMNIGYYLSVDTMFSPLSDTYITSETINLMGANHSIIRTSNINLPSNTPVGDYYLFAVADYNSNVDETNEKNNTIYSKIRVHPSGADLVINNALLNVSSTPAGSTITTTSMVLNNGNIQSSSNYLGFYLSSDNKYSTNDTYLGNSYIGYLSSNASSNITYSITIPSTTTIGNYYIIFFADYNNRTTELDETNNYAYQALSIVKPDVDLSITNVNVNASLTTSSSSYINYYIMNNGNTASTSTFEVGYYLSKDATFSTNDVYLGNETIYSITSGNSIYESDYFTIPSSVSSGSYYLLVVVDHESVISETNENNNTYSKPITVTLSGPDLTVSSATVPNSTVSSGDIISLSSTTTNSGTASSNYSYIGYYLSEDVSYSSSDVYLGSTYVSSISTNSSRTVSSSIALPSSVQSGSYYILFKADYNNNITETDETNNVIARSITFGKADIDLIISSSTVSSTTLASGLSYYSSATVKNTGSSPSGYSYLTAYLSTNTTISSDDVYLGQSYVSGLSAGGTSQEGLSLSIPTNITNGNYYVLFVVDYENAVSEKNEANNIDYKAVTISTPSPDLTVSGSSVSATTIAPGTIITAMATVKNIGTSTSNSSYLGVYLSSNSTYSSEDVLLDESYVNSLSSQYSSTEYINMTIPSSTATGTYYILFIADKDSEVSETKENNNLDYKTISIVKPNFDHNIHKLYPVSSVFSPSYNFNLYYQLLNIGTTSAPSTTINFYLSTDNKLNTAIDIYLGNDFVSVLEAKKEFSKTFSPIIPSNTVYGNYYIIAQIDPTNANKEIDESNNIQSFGIKVTATGIDLEPNKLKINTNIYPNGYISVNQTVKNQGNLNVSSNKISYYLSKDSILSKTSDAVLTTLTRSVTPNGSTELNFLLSIPQSTIGTYYIISSVDDANEITETDETNNLAFAKFGIISPSGDLGIYLSDTTLTTIDAGDSIYLTYYIYNNGVVNVEDTKVKIYLSRNDTISDDDILLSTTTVSGLLTDDEIFKTATMTTNSSLSGGDYYLIVVADPDNEIKEANEKDNQASYIININPIDGLFEKENREASISIYPNPVVSKLSIESNENIEHITILDLTGKIIYTQQQYILRDNINLDFLNSGTYILQFSNKNGEVMRKTFNVTR